MPDGKRIRADQEGVLCNRAECDRDALVKAQMDGRAAVHGKNAAHRSELCAVCGKVVDRAGWTAAARDADYLESLKKEHI